jgi:AAA+ ATPase superfamily predicted ATPase
VLPVTEHRQSRAYHTQYQLTDNFFRFWFRFIELNQGAVEFGAGERVVDAIMAELSDYMGLPFEALCRDWVRLASAAGALDALPAPVGTVGTWWNPDHQVDVVGLDARHHIAVTGECKWRVQGFTWSDLQTYLDHVRALAQAAPLHPDALHVLFSKEGFDERVRAWAAGTRARLLGPADLLAPI